MDKKMENLLIMDNVAYLRTLHSTYQFELSFTLKMTIGAIDINEQIRAVRQISDTVGSLLQHTKNKINRIITSKYDSDENLPDVPIIFKRRSKPIRETTVLKEFIKQNHKHSSFIIGHNRYTVIADAPLIKSMFLPEVIFANFTIQPRKFQTLYTESQLSEFTWFRSEDTKNWVIVGNSWQYEVTEADVGHYLKLRCVPRNETSTGPLFEAVSPGRVQMMVDIPSECPFEDRHRITNSFLEAPAFRVVSYNVLASRYAETNEQFPYCPPEVLAIDYRKQLIIKELLGYKADVICLQEVDDNVYKGYFKKIFHQNNYGTTYYRKGNRIPEGLCCCFNKSKFRLLKSEQLVFSHAIGYFKHFANILDLVNRNRSLKDMFMKQATSFQTSVLQSKQGDSVLIVGNTHLFYHPDASHIRLIQIWMTLLHLQKKKDQMKKEGVSHISTVLCGDFNSNPCSTVYSFITTGEVPSDNEYCLKISENKLISPKHNFKFVSASGTPTYTNYTSTFKSCLDYIFIEEDQMDVLQVVPLPSNEELGKYEGLPNELYPSDHLALVCDIVMKL